MTTETQTTVTYDLWRKHKDAESFQVWLPRLPLEKAKDFALSYNAEDTEGFTYHAVKVMDTRTFEIDTQDSEDLSTRPSGPNGLGRLLDQVERELQS